MEHRIIRIGHQTMIGVVCPHCVLRTIIYPESAFLVHQRLHHVPSRALVYHRKAGNTRGRPPGTPRPQMGATIIFHEGIRAR